MKMILPITFIFLIASCRLYAYSNYYNQSPIGWHWNNVVEPLKNKKTPYPKTNQNNPIQKMKRIHYLLHYYQDRALLNPTVENIKDYLMVQNMIMQQSTLFSQNWQKTILLYPEFNYRISHPTDSAILQLAQSNLHQKEIAVVKILSKKLGLLFFYNGNNPLSNEMAKTVFQFSSLYHFSTITVSMDGKIIKSNLPSQMNQGQAENLQIKALPALVLVNPKTGWHQVLTYGYASEDDLLSDCYNVYSRTL